MSKEERGQVTVLVLGLALVVFAVAGLAVDGTRAFLLRRTLQNAADSAALAAASTLDPSAYYSTGGGDVTLDARAARAQAAATLAQRGVGARSGVEIGATTVRIVLRDQVPTTFLRLIGVSQLPVAVEATAEPIAGAAGSPP